MSKYSEALELSEEDRKKLAEEIDYEKRRMTQPEGQPTTMTWQEKFDEEFRTHFKGMSEHSHYLHPFVESLISNAKEEERKHVVKAFTSHRYQGQTAQDVISQIDFIAHALSSNNPKS